LIDEVGNQTAPAGLVRSAASTPVVAIEIFVKKYKVLKMGICLKLLILTKHWTSSCIPELKDIHDAPTQLVRDLVESHHDARSCRALDHEPVTVELVEAAQVLD